jgi:hypothetical protein
MVLHYDIEHLREGRASMTPLIWLSVPLFSNFNVRVRRIEHSQRRLTQLPQSASSALSVRLPIN